MDSEYVVDLNSETQLVEAAQNGQLESFGVLYERYHSPMVALAYSMLADRDLAEDAAQEVFAVACRDIGSLKSQERFAAWLAGICRNVSRQMLKANERFTAEHAEAAESYKLNGSSATGWQPQAELGAGSNPPGPKQALSLPPGEKDDPCAQDRQEAIRRAVWSLRESERELIVLRYFDGFSQARISEVLGLSSQAVNGRLVRAKRKITKYLKRNGVTGDYREKSSRQQMAR